MGNLLRFLIARAMAFDLEIHQMDVESAYLNSDIDKDIYMQQIKGYEDADHPDWVCKLNKGIYGLHQAIYGMKPLTNTYSIAASHKSIPASTFAAEGMTVSIIALFVDDKTLFCDTELLEWISLSGRFRVKDLGEISSMLGVEAMPDVAHHPYHPIWPSGSYFILLSAVNILYAVKYLS